MKEKIKQYWNTTKVVLKTETKTNIGTVLSVGLITVVLSCLMGLFVFGWWLFPVQWEPTKMYNIPEESQEVYVHVLSEWYAYTQNDVAMMRYAQEIVGLDTVACRMAGETDDINTMRRYIKLAYLQNGVGCP